MKKDNIGFVDAKRLNKQFDKFELCIKKKLTNDDRLIGCLDEVRLLLVRLISHIDQTTQYIMRHKKNEANP